MKSITQFIKDTAHYLNGAPSFDEFLHEAEYRLSAGIARLEKAFPREQAAKHGVDHMSTHLQSVHGFPKHVADEAAQRHHDFQNFIHAHTGPEFVSKDSSD